MIVVSPNAKWAEAAQPDDLRAAPAGAFHDIATRVGGLDDDHPAVIRVRSAGDQAQIAQRVDDARHRGWRDLFGSGQGREGARTAEDEDRERAQPSGRDTRLAIDDLDGSQQVDGCTVELQGGACACGWVAGGSVACACAEGGSVVITVVTRVGALATGHPLNVA